MLVRVGPPAYQKTSGLVRAGDDAAWVAEGEAVHRHQVVEGAEGAVRARRRGVGVLVDDALAVSVEGPAAVVGDDRDHRLGLGSALLEDEQPTVGEGQGIGRLAGEPGRGRARSRSRRRPGSRRCGPGPPCGSRGGRRSSTGPARRTRAGRCAGPTTSCRGGRRPGRTRPRSPARPRFGRRRRIGGAAGVAPDARVVVGLERLERAEEPAVGERQQTLARVLDVPAVGQLPGLGPGLAAVVRSRDEVADRDEPLGDRVVRRPARTSCRWRRRPRAGRRPRVPPARTRGGPSRPASAPANGLASARQVAPSSSLRTRRGRPSAPSRVVPTRWLSTIAPDASRVTRGSQAWPAGSSGSACQTVAWSTTSIRLTPPTAASPDRRTGAGRSP